MHIDIASILIAMTVSMTTMSLALPAVMGKVNEAARRAQAGVVLQAAGWVMLLASGLFPPGSTADWLLSTLSMTGIAGGLALNATAFDLWCGRAAHAWASAIIAVVMPVGYALGFSSYPFRVGWANGLLTLQMGLVVASLSKPPGVPVGRWRWLLVVSLLAQMLVTAGRGILGAFITADYPTFLTPHPVNLAFALLANATAVLSLVAILLAHRDETARELERLATIDGLTGALNRRAWMVRATSELDKALRHGFPVAVLMIDIDHFKQVNDTRGHEAGDRALSVFAFGLRSAARKGDLVGRYGGEEFCVLMTYAEADATSAFDVRLRDHLFETAVDELGFELSYSAGTALFEGPDDTLAAMLKRADENLFVAKRQGRSRTLHADGSSTFGDSAFGPASEAGEFS